MRLYFSGIGGAGLGPLANLALDAGYEVTGSDEAASLFIDSLTQRGVQISIGQSLEEIAASYEKTPFDWLVITSALPPTHPHIIFAAQKEIRISKRHEVINEIIEAKKLKMIAVAGTHGKTTTTAMMVWAMKELNIPVSYSIGSNISFGVSAQYEKKSEYFIYEADEFDRNFLHFTPFGSILTKIDFDHSDTYSSIDDYYQAFADFASQTSDSVVCWKEDLEKIKDFLPMKSYVRNPKPFIADGIKDEVSTQNMMRSIGLLGLHNRENAFLVLTMLLGICENDIDEVVDVLRSFPGTQRRFEKLMPNLITDYAHHPAEIESTIAMGREYMNQNNITGKLTIVYQPHQNIRQHEELIQEGYKTCFAHAHNVYWLPTYLSRENPDLEVISPETLAAKVGSTNLVEIANLDDMLATNIQKHLDSGDLVIGMGAGSIDNWLRKKWHSDENQT